MSNNQVFTHSSHILFSKYSRKQKQKQKSNSKFKSVIFLTNRIACLSSFDNKVVSRGQGCGNRLNQSAKVAVTQRNGSKSQTRYANQVGFCSKYDIVQNTLTNFQHIQKQKAKKAEELGQIIRKSMNGLNYHEKIQALKNSTFSSKYCNVKSKLKTMAQAQSHRSKFNAQHQAEKSTYRSIYKNPKINKKNANRQLKTQYKQNQQQQQNNRNNKLRIKTQMPAQNDLRQIDEQIEAYINSNININVDLNLDRISDLPLCSRQVGCQAEIDNSNNFTELRNYPGTDRNQSSIRKRIKTLEDYCKNYQAQIYTHIDDEQKIRNKKKRLRTVLNKNIKNKTLIPKNVMYMSMYMRMHNLQPNKTKRSETSLKQMQMGNINQPSKLKKQQKKRSVIKNYSFSQIHSMCKNSPRHNSTENICKKARSNGFNEAKINQSNDIENGANANVNINGKGWQGVRRNSKSAMKKSNQYRTRKSNLAVELCSPTIKIDPW